MIVNKLTVKNLVDFRRYSEKRQSNFANQLKIPKMAVEKDSEGGNYWVRSQSGLSTSFRFNDNKIVTQRLESIINDNESASDKKVKLMYERNIKILHEYEDFDFSTWGPPFSLKFLSKPKMALTIKDVPIYIAPHHVFAYKENDEQKVGGILIVTSLKGFQIGDLGLFSEALYKYISVLYSADYKVEPAFCFTVDALTKQRVNYNQVLTGAIPPLLEPTIEILKKYLN